MEETLKMMKSILNRNEGKINENELIKEYQNKLSPYILAHFYVSNYKLIYTISQNYRILTEEDRASFCLQELNKCLQTYDMNKNVKFTTYFVTCFKRRLYAETQMLNHANRKAIIFCEDKSELQIPNTVDLITDENYILDNYN